MIFMIWYTTYTEYVKCYGKHKKYIEYIEIWYSWQKLIRMMKTTVWRWNGINGRKMMKKSDLSSFFKKVSLLGSREFENHAVSPGENAWFSNPLDPSKRTFLKNEDKSNFFMTFSLIDAISPPNSIFDQFISFWQEYCISMYSTYFLCFLYHFMYSIYFLCQIMKLIDSNVFFDFLVFLNPLAFLVLQDSPKGRNRLQDIVKMLGIA